MEELPSGRNLVGTDEPSTSPVISSSALARKARARTGFLHGWRRAVSAWVVVLLVGVIAGKTWPNASGVAEWLIGAAVSAFAGLLLVGTEWAYRRIHARSDILTERLQNSNTLREADKCAFAQERATLQADVRRLTSELTVARSSTVDRPQVDVQLVRDGRFYQLRTTNHGATATFHARMKVLASSGGAAAERGVRRLWWERARKIEARVATSGDDSVRIGQVYYDGFWNIALYAFSEDSQTPQSFWNVGYVPNNNMPQITLIEVTVTAEPEIVGGPWTGYISIGPTSAAIVDMPLPVDETGARRWLAGAVAQEIAAQRAAEVLDLMQPTPDNEPPSPKESESTDP